jgi:phosphatidylglycerophosphatase A
MTAIAVALATGLYLSFIPAYLVRSQKYTGAGLIGTAWGVVLLPWLPLNPIAQIAVWLGACAMALVISDIAEERLRQKDDPRIIIDETVGYWTAMLFLPRSWPAIVAAFLLFRIFDVWKPLGIRRLGHLPGGWGVLLDDIGAGVAANLLLQIAQRVHPF